MQADCEAGKVKTAWVVMSQFDSPIAICFPTPKAVSFNKKKAQKYCDDHNANPRTSTEYYLRKVKVLDGEEK